MNDNNIKCCSQYFSKKKTGFYSGLILISIRLEVLVNVFGDDWREGDDRNHVFFLWNRITNSDI